MKVWLCIMLLCLAVTGCKKKTEEPKETNPALEIRIECAEDVLTKVWACYDEEDKFSIIGGDVDNMAMGYPCNFNLIYVEEMESRLGVPESAAEMLADAASMADEMDSFKYTAAAYALKDSSDVIEFRTAVEETLLKKSWGEETPEKLVIAVVDESYVVVAFGQADRMETFVEILEYATDAEVVVNKDWK